MNAGLLLKSFREIRPITLGMGLLMFIASLLIAFSSRQIRAAEFSALLDSKFLQQLISNMVGTLVTAELGKHLAQTLACAHPLIMLILFAHNVTITTQMPVGEIDRGTIDVLLGMPVSRARTYACHALVWMGSGALVILFGLAGNWCGTHMANDTLASPLRMTIVMINSFCLYFAIGGFGYFVSSACSRRIKAVTIIITFIVAISLINVVADAVAGVRFLNQFSPISYFRPIFIFRDGHWPVRSIATLLATGATFWILGLIIFQRRDLHS